MSKKRLRKDPDWGKAFQVCCMMDSPKYFSVGCVYPGGIVPTNSSFRLGKQTAGPSWHQK